MQNPEDRAGAEDMVGNPKVISAGGLVVRFVPPRWVTVLVGSGAPVVWRIPKGMQDAGETIEQTAVREVREETGLTASIIEFLGTGSWTYEYGGRIWDETCHFFLMRCDGGDTACHDGEYERVDWVALDRASDRLFYPIEQGIAVRAQESVPRHTGRLLTPDGPGR